MKLISLVALCVFTLEIHASALPYLLNPSDDQHHTDTKKTVEKLLGKSKCSANRIQEACTIMKSILLQNKARAFLPYLLNPADASQHVGTKKTLEELLTKCQFSVNLIRQACVFVKSISLPNPSCALRIPDPHVGETCCEIRAHMYSSFTVDSHTIDEIAAIEQEAESFLAMLQQAPALAELLVTGTSAKGTTFLQFLSEHLILPQQELPDLLKLVRNSLLLTQAKASSFKFASDTFTADNLEGNHLVDKAGVAHGFPKKQFKEIAHGMQKHVACASVQYVQTELSQLKPNENIGLSQALIDELIKAIGPNGCCLINKEKSAAAYFPLIFTLYSRTLEKQIPLLLKLIIFDRNEPMFYRMCLLYVPQEGKFVMVPLEEYSRQKGMVLEALSFHGSYEQLKFSLQKRKRHFCAKLSDEALELCQSLANQDLFTNLLADATMHSQFSASKEENIEADNCIYANKHSLPLLAAYMKHLQVHALATGVCQKNMKLFYLKHVSAGVLSNQLMKE